MFRLNAFNSGAVYRGAIIPNKFSAIGGTTLTANGYKYHIFTTSDTFSITGVTNTSTIDVLIVSGGGAGSTQADSGGGGGGGGVLTFTSLPVSIGACPVVVGAGGAVNATNYYGDRGGNSSITVSGTVYSTVGGGGGAYNSGNANSNGGSGGGQGGSGSGQGSVAKGVGIYPGSTYISGTRQGYDGGSSINLDSGGSAGGGGGAGGAGGNAAQNVGGAGGAAIANPWQDSQVGKLVSTTYYLSGGGGGGSRGGTGGTGGAGGGNGGTNANPNTSTPGTVNTGGGGGGDGISLFNWGGNGSPGGSGVVVVRYPA